MLILAATAMWPLQLWAADWPTLRRDVGRSGQTDEQLDAARLALSWSHRLQTPQPAWDGPAKWDAFGNKPRLNSLRDYDEVFHVCVVGTSLFYGSSADDSVRCLDTRTGEQQWIFVTDGPVRMVPTWADGLLYFGSDDGHAYCVQAEDGKLVWKVRPADDQHRVLNDGRLISFYPVRTGVLVDGGTAYFAGALLPWQPSYLAAVDAKTGKAEGAGRYIVKLDGMTMEGGMLATSERLVLPQGRVSPALVERTTGKVLGALHTAGAGCFVLLAPKNEVFHGPGNRDGALIQSSVEAPPPKKTTRAQMAQFPGGRAMVIGPKGWYLMTNHALASIDPETRKARWQIKEKGLLTLILGGDTLYVGGDDRVTAYRADDGAVLWQANVPGQAQGLAVADAALWVSTDDGSILCFRPSDAAKPTAAAKTGASRESAATQVNTDAEAGIEVGPYVQFTAPGTAVVRWQTTKPSPTVLMYGERDVAEHQIQQGEARTYHHEVKLTKLRHRRDYVYSIETTFDGQVRRTPQHVIETFFNYTLPAIHEDPSRFAELVPGLQMWGPAERALETSNVSSGMCLVLGNSSGLMSWEIVRRSRLKVIALEANARDVERARWALMSSGVYGTRIEVLHLPQLDTSLLPGQFADLIVSASVLEGADPAVSAAEVVRLLKPGGGTVVLGQGLGPDRLRKWAAGTPLVEGITATARGTWLQYVRPQLSGIGHWTHQYGSTSNAAYAGETLAGVKESGDLVTQWVGRPGPRYHPDRSGRKPGPLAAGGRLFAQGLNRLIAIDQYNGMILWSLEMPPMLRMNMPRDCSNWCADEKRLYVAVGPRCWSIDAAAGKVENTWEVQPGPRKDWKYQWGYVGRLGGVLLGSAVKAGSTYTEFWGQSNWYESGNDKVLSDNLFALDPVSGKAAWTYQGGLIINSTICASTGRIFFIENRSQQPKDQPSRRVNKKAGLWNELFHVALDPATGQKLWERPLAIKSGDVALLQSCDDETLVLVSSAPNRYYIYAFAAADGAPIWQAREPWGKGRADHGSHLSIPAIVGDRLYVRPAVFELKSGKKLPLTIPVGGCGTYACSTDALFQRGGSGTNALVWAADTGKVTQLNRLRPDCWLSTIPAGGMLLSPESGGGCSCGVWMETSVGFMPRSVAAGSAKSN
jgi:outer membrane protein assembly factor BamB